MPPVASPDTTCWIKMSIMFWGGASAAPPPDPPTGSSTLLAGAPSPDSTTFLGACSVAEVGAADRVVPLQLRGGAGHHHASRFEEVGVIRQVEGHRGVLLDEKHAHALLLVDRSHDAEDLAGDQRRQAERRLVKQEQARTRHEGARHREHLLLAARERARLLPLPLGEGWEILVDALEVGGNGRPVAAHVRAQPQ